MKSFAASMQGIRRYSSKVTKLQLPLLVQKCTAVTCSLLMATSNCVTAALLLTLQFHNRISILDGLTGSERVSENRQKHLTLLCKSLF